ncbi:MAG: hypothetical protein AAF655_13840 [Bacteroidota bacterium]
MKANTYRKLPHFGLLAIASLLLAGLELSAQSERSPQWKAQYEYATRYEGEHNDSYVYRELALIGYYAGIQPYQFDFGQNLSVHFYSPQATKAYLKAEELVVRNRYWMETKEGSANPGWNTFMHWPVDLWLTRGRIRSDNLGLIAKMKIGNGYGDYYLPTLVNQGRYPGPISQYYVMFRSGMNMEGGVVRLYAGTPTRSGLPDFSQELGAPIRINSQAAGQSFGIRLSQEQLGSYKGWITLEITCKKRNQQDLHEEVYYLYHPGWSSSSVPIINGTK